MKTSLLYTYIRSFLIQKDVRVRRDTLSFRVFMHVCIAVITSIFGKGFHFPFPYFMLLYLVVFII